MGSPLFANLSNLYLFLQYPDYIDAYLRLAAIAKARNNVHISLELVVIALLAFLFGYFLLSVRGLLILIFSFVDY